MILGYTHRAEPYSAIIRKVFKLSSAAKANKYRETQQGFYTTLIFTHSLTPTDRETTWNTQL